MPVTKTQATGILTPENVGAYGSKVEPYPAGGRNEDGFDVFGGAVCWDSLDGICATPGVL
jgi:hypothetical protein